MKCVENSLMQFGNKQIIVLNLYHACLNIILLFLLQEARAYFRQLLTESTQKLDTLAKKLGTCIEKARPYYEARMRAKEVCKMSYFFKF